MTARARHPTYGGCSILPWRTDTCSQLGEDGTFTSNELILVVDDDPDVRTVVEITLQLAGFDVITASSGRAGIEMAKTRGPHLVILDVMMEEMDGLEVLSRLKSDPRLSHIPVIFLTAKEQINDKVIGLEAGADDYVTKPFDADELVARAAVALRRGRALRDGVASVDSDSIQYQWDFFISHASADKESFVTPLAMELRDRGIRTWYDDFEIRLGDSLRSRIEEGLASSHFGLVVLSPAFLQGRVWTERELSGLMSANKRVLPLFHRVTPGEVASRKPILADLKGILTRDQSVSMAAQTLERFPSDPDFADGVVERAVSSALGVEGLVVAAGVARGVRPGD